MLTPTANGQYLDPGKNPGFQTMVGRTVAAVRPNIDTTFASSGRYGSGLAARAQAEGVGDAVGALAYGDYSRERQNQLAAANQIGANYATERGNQMTALGAVPSYAAGATAPGTAQSAAASSALRMYLSALQGLQVGTTGIYSQAQDTAGHSTGDGSSGTSGWNFGF
jgi:hypothetical protein